MIDGLIERINVEILLAALSAAQYVTPSISADQNFTTFHKEAFIGLVQINYTDDLTLSGYDLGKIYVSINEFTELAFTREYAPHAINFAIQNDESVIHSYTPAGIALATYQIDRSVLDEEATDRPYMTKSTGDIYLPHFICTENEKVDVLRKAWGQEDSLLCYSYKLDGRISFYVTTSIPLDIDLNALELFEHGGSIRTSE